MSGPAAATPARRVALTLLAMVVVWAGGLVGAAEAATGPCHSCGGFNRGDQTVFGGTFQVRVQPPRGRAQGDGHPGGGVADCSGIPLPAAPALPGGGGHRWPLQPMPCNLLSFDYFWNPGVACPDPAALSYAEIVGFPPFGRWVPGGRFRLCLTPADFRAAGATPPPGLVAVAAWRQMPFPDPRIQAKPAVKGLANLPSYFWVAGPATQTRSVSVGPYVVSVTATIVDYTWSWGDHTPQLSTNDPGTAWPAKSTITHPYPRRGRYPVTVASRWHGTFRINGGPTQDVIGPDVSRTATLPYAVQELRVTLTG